MNQDAFRFQVALVAIFVAGCFWLRAVVTDYKQDRPAWIILAVLCPPCGTVRGVVLWWDKDRLPQRLSSADSPPNTPARVRIAPITA